MTLDWIISGAYGNYWWNVNETSVYLLLDVQSTPHPGLADGDALTYDVSMSYGGGADVIETFTLTYAAAAPTSSVDVSIRFMEKLSSDALTASSNEK